MPPRSAIQAVQDALRSSDDDYYVPPIPQEYRQEYRQGEQPLMRGYDGGGGMDTRGGYGMGGYGRGGAGMEWDGMEGSSMSGPGDDSPSLRPVGLPGRYLPPLSRRIPPSQVAGPSRPAFQAASTFLHHPQPTRPLQYTPSLPQAYHREQPGYAQGPYHSQEPSYDEYPHDTYEDLPSNYPEEQEAYRPVEVARRQGLNTHGIPSVPTSRLPDMYRQIFKFEYFNAVQSKVFSSAYESDENLVVSSPTGSGKTAIFELCILRLHSKPSATTGDGRMMAVYMAPTKALCAERIRDWGGRFGGVGLKCVEFTGDTAASKDFYHEAKTADIVVTTPEKWDALTRRSTQNARILSRLGLLLIDEVHFLHDSRGATLEVVVSRMKQKGGNVRMVALSATVPNVEDVARWLRPTVAASDGVFEAGGSSGASTANEALKLPMAKVYKFGEDFRPTRLTRHVYGFSSPNPWALSKMLEKEIFALLEKHAANKPVLVFCPTRKSCQSFADAIRKCIEERRAAGHRLPWTKRRDSGIELKDRKMKPLIEEGIAVHHAGLELPDRKAIEQAFKTGDIMLITATSTLAVGVNLPAHTVVIAGTRMWDGSGLVEYPDIEMQQMFGRAGRPQFDTSGTVIVMCDKAQEQKYKDLLGSTTILESQLHKSLTEHINSEIGLRTIQSVENAQEWMRSSFLHIRIQQNPKHYASALGPVNGTAATWKDALDDFMAEAIKKLNDNQLVSENEVDELASPLGQKAPLSSTAYGDVMSSCILRYPTMISIMGLPTNASVRALLEVLSAAEEFADLKPRQGDKPVYNKLNTSGDIRYPLAGKVVKASDKVFLLIQALFGNLSLEDYKSDDKADGISTTLDSFTIFKTAGRIVKAMVAVGLERKDGGTARSALELSRCVHGKAWENTATIFRQIDTIGTKSIKTLALHGVKTFEALLKLDSGRLAMLLDKSPQATLKIQDDVRKLPQFSVEINELSVNSTNGDGPVEVNVEVIITSKGSLALLGGTKGKKGKGGNLTVSVLAVLSDGTYVAFRRMQAKHFAENNRPIKLNVQFTKPSQKFQIIAGVDQYSGCTTEQEYKPDLPGEAFPVPADIALVGEPTGTEKDEVSPEDLLIGRTQAVRAPPERLPNGNWKCAHTCKKQCKHPCCVSGVAKKPKGALRAIPVPDVVPMEEEAPHDEPGPSRSAECPSPVRRFNPINPSAYEVVPVLEGGDEEGSDTEGELPSIEGIMEKAGKRKAREPSEDYDGDGFLALMDYYTQKEGAESAEKKRKNAPLQASSSGNLGDSDTLVMDPMLPVKRQKVETAGKNTRKASNVVRSPLEPMEVDPPPASRFGKAVRGEPLFYLESEQDSVQMSDAHHGEELDCVPVAKSVPFEAPLPPLRQEEEAKEEPMQLDPWDEDLLADLEKYLEKPKSGEREVVATDSAGSVSAFAMEVDTAPVSIREEQSKREEVTRETLPSLASMPSSAGSSGSRTFVVEVQRSPSVHLPTASPPAEPAQGKRITPVAVIVPNDEDEKMEPEPEYNEADAFMDDLEDWLKASGGRITE